MTRKQIEVLKMNVQIAVRANADNTTAIMAKIKEIDKFLVDAWELHLIADYNEVLKLQKEIGQAAMNELDKLQKEIA